MALGVKPNFFTRWALADCFKCVPSVLTGALPHIVSVGLPAALRARYILHCLEFV